MAAKRPFVRRSFHPAAAAPAAQPAASLSSGPSNPDDPGVQGDGGIGQPLQYASELAPWQHPQFMPGDPQRLPGLVRGPVSPLIGFQLPSPTTPTPGVSSTTTSILDPHHYAAITEGSVVGSTAAGTGTAFLTQPAGLRNLLLLRNPSTNTGSIYVGFGTPAGLLSSLKIDPGQTYLFDEVVPQNDVYAFSSAGETLAYAFSNIPPAT